MALQIFPKFIQFSGKNTRCLFPNPGEVERWGECNLNQTKVKTFVGILRQHYEDGHHVSVSWEGLSLLSDERIEFLGSVFRAAGYEPRIVVSSRYYHEWVPSWIQQYFRPAKYNKQLDKFEDAGGARIPTLPQFLADPLFYHRYCYFGFDDCHYDWLSTSNAPAASLRNRFKRFFPSVQLFQYSQEGDLVTNFICQALQFADKTCHGLQDGTLTSPERDLQKSLLLITMDYQYLAQAAYDKYNLVHFSEKRQVFAKRIRRHHERLISQQCKGKCSNETELPFDRLCLSKNEKELFANRTISYELEVFPSDFVQSDGGKKYEELLWNMILDRTEDDKYCALDVNKTLVKPEWELFFRGLEPRTKKKNTKSPP